jgi:TM2 domain-containing membrane protein YozV
LIYCGELTDDGVKRTATTLTIARNNMNSGQGSTGNVIAALCSLFIPGLGQLIQGRLLSAMFWFVAACIAFAVTWLITLSLLPFGWFLVSIFSCISAARFRG